MFDIERFLEEKLNPVFKGYYAIWVYWWPLWRRITRRDILRKWQQTNLVREGCTFLDYGCGTGAFTIPAAKIVGTRGKVYALDYFPRQLEIVKEELQKEGLANLETILSNQETGLPDESIDVIWMCDVLHEIKERRAVLEELHRVLRKEGTLAFYDGMKEKVLNYTNGLFSLTEKEGKLFKFAKIT
ncbi:MAG: class I SAM-dependent methyltransferase [Chloroflexi bacterium]|nr:class I SAM-dependent methyltransferase [Chloroflexota bacterium]MBI2979832.1 class I SAM-dependent methyltransferase [Chloroflexota bacterium]